MLGGEELKRSERTEALIGLREALGPDGVLVDLNVVHRPGGDRGAPYPAHGDRRVAVPGALPSADSAFSFR